VGVTAPGIVPEIVRGHVAALVAQHPATWSQGGRHPIGQAGVWLGSGLWDELVQQVEQQPERDSWLEPNELLAAELTFPVLVDAGWLRVFAILDRRLEEDLLLDDGVYSPDIRVDPLNWMTTTHRLHHP
jgi:hypothetical protein